MSEYKKFRQTGSDLIFDVANHVLLTLALISVLYPLVYIISASLSSPIAVMSGRVWLLPVDFGFQGYHAVLKNRQVWTGYGNSLFYTAAGTVINIIMTVLAAYPLSRKGVIGRNPIMFLFTFTMLFSGGLIPNYLLVKNLGMIDSRWALLIPGAMTVWNMIITRTYFQTTIPNELYDSAEVDGCKDIGILFRIVLPVSGPIIAVNALFYAVDHWNAYFSALIYLKSAKLYPLQIILRNILIANQTDASMVADVADLAAREGMKDLVKYSLIVVASLPALIIYPFVQKYFVKGVMIGSIKG